MNKNWCKFLLPLTIAACSTGGNIGMDVTTMPEQPEMVYRDHELYKIDSTLKQVGIEHDKAAKAISIYDAEKVYLERFAQSLQDRRKGVCKKLTKDLLAEPACEQ